jgi:cysteine-rich repeat protein
VFCGMEPLFTCTTTDQVISVCTPSCGAGGYEPTKGEECDDGNTNVAIDGCS